MESCCAIDEGFAERAVTATSTLVFSAIRVNFIWVGAIAALSNAMVASSPAVTFDQDFEVDALGVVVVVSPPGVVPSLELQLWDRAAR